MNMWETMFAYKSSVPFYTITCLIAIGIGFVSIWVRFNLTSLEFKRDIHQLQAKFEELQNKIDELKRDLEELKRK